MVIIKVDKDLIVSELYNLLSKIDIDNEEARKHVLYMIDLVQKCPQDLKNSSYPKIGAQSF